MNSDGQLLVETLFVVATTPFRVVKTTTTTTDYGLRGTIRTHSSYFLGSDGRITPSLIYVVGTTPVEPSLSTEYRGKSKSITTTTVPRP